MGLADLRNAFNGAAPEGFTCTKAFLDYVRDNGERQVLTFFGTDASGNTFEVKSAKLGPGADILAAARETAKGLKGNAP